MSDLLSRVNWVDIFALILLIKISYVSSRIGVGKQILPLILLALILTISLYNYRDIAAFFIDRYSFMPSVCRFLSFTLMAIVFAIIYRITSRITGMCLFPGETAEAGGIERVGGAILGILRSVFIIGIILIMLLLVPVKFVESSVKNSYLGPFLISANVKAYTSGLKLVSKDEEISYKEELSELLAKKEGYLFEPVDMKKKSRFFKEEC